MAVQQIDSYFAEELSSIEQFELIAGGDLDASAIEEMFDRFLTPHCEESPSPNIGNARAKAPPRCSIDERLDAEQLTEELLKRTIDLALATLEAAESALFAKLMLE